MRGQLLDVGADRVSDCGRYTSLRPCRAHGPGIVRLRKDVLVENGDLVAEPGVGQFVERAAFGQELLPAAAR